ncbi:MAG: MFS transporter [Christensenellaceae bacterium]|nr:MFS transporter [Christensenellaceae bacterium]
MNLILRKISDTATDIRAHWKRPAPKNFIPYREMANYSIAGLGYNFVGILSSYLGLAATNTFIGSVIGIRPVDIQNMNIVMSVISALFSLIRGTIVDNTKTRWGKFRPYILFFGLPVVAIDILFVFLPFETYSYTEKIFYIMLVSLGHGFLAAFFTDTYSELKSVMSPNTEERTILITMQSMVMSFAPTLTNLFVPILMDSIPGNYTNVIAYRWVIAPIAAVGLFFTLFAAFGTKERTILPKQYKPKVRLVKGILQIYKNKYFWVKNLHSWLGFLEGAFGALFGWMFIYYLQDMLMMGLVQTINGVAGGICMLITPYVLRRMGNRRMLLMVNILNVLFVTLISLTFKLPVMYFTFNWLNTFLNMFYIVGDPVMHCEVKDYQQYLSGERLDFLFGSANIIGTPIGILSGMVIPRVYESMGLTTNYDVLYDPAVRDSMFKILCYLSVIGSIMNLLPLLFYDLTAIKHRNIIKVLRLRAMFNDYISENGDVPADMIKTNIEQIREAHKYASMERPNLKQTRSNFLTLLKTKRGDTTSSGAHWKSIRTAFLDISKAKDLYDEIDTANIVLNELNKFSTKEFETKVELANQTLEYSFSDVLNIPNKILDDAKNIQLPDRKELIATAKRNHASDSNIAEILKTIDKDYREQAMLRRFQINRAKGLLKMRNLSLKYYPNGLTVPDPQVYKDAQNMPASNNNERKLKFKALKAAESAINLYHRTAEVYIDAQNLIQHKRAYLAFPEIAERYEEACKIVDEQEKLRLEKEEQAKNEKRAELDRVRAERFAKFSPAKQARILKKQALKDEMERQKKDSEPVDSKESDDLQDSNITVDENVIIDAEKSTTDVTEETSQISTSEPDSDNNRKDSNTNNEENK